MRTVLMSPVSTAASISVAEGMDCAAVAAACCWQPEAAINKTQTSNRIVDMVVPCPSGAMVRISFCAAGRGRKSVVEGKSGEGRVDRGGRRIIKKKNNRTIMDN